MDKNILIVERINDKYIIEHILKNLKINKNINIEPPLDNSLDFIELDGSDLKKISDKLTELKSDILKSKAPVKIGIILDLDKNKIEERIALINKAIETAYENKNSISNENKFEKIELEEISFDLACHFICHQGEGELEDLLHALRPSGTFFSDGVFECCQTTCFSDGKTLSLKELGKLRMDFYRRFDILTKAEKKQAKINVQWDNFLSNHPEAFDFNKNVTELDNLKAFLKLFST